MTTNNEAQAQPITALYTNWRGETAMRTFIPRRVFYGSNEWHPEPQVLIEATDCNKGELRTFAAAGFAQPVQGVEAVRVKALVWDENGSAEAPFGAYFIYELDDDEWQWHRSEYPYPEPSEPLPTEAEAKAAAQADYEARIRSALDLPNASSEYRRGLEDAEEVAELIASINTAETWLSEHIEFYHDYEEETPERSALRRIQHHLIGSLIGEDGEPIRALAGNPAPVTPRVTVSFKTYTRPRQNPAHTYDDPPAPSPGRPYY